jgi:Protein of unknown function (DUF2795)
MSMISTGTGSPSFALPSSWGSRSRISWGAVLAGAVVAVATALLLSLLGAAIGAGSIHALEARPGDAEGYGIGAGIWTMINLALSMALGGYVASRLSGTHSHLDGELHGMTMWGVAVLLGSVLLAHAVSGVIDMTGLGVGPAASRASGEAGPALGPLAAEMSPQLMIDRFERSLGNSGDPTTMSREQIGAEISALLGGGLLRNGSISEADRTRLVPLVAAEFGVTKEEAAQRVARMESDAKAGVAQAEQSARVEADEIASGTAAAARALFTALVLGLLAALIGAWIGTRHKRVLHPEEAHAAGAANANVGHAGYEMHEPVSVSVYDDTDHLVAQYLRGVSFPVSKQDLLRLARSSNAGAGLVHSIEGMADRSYANANEVLGALGIVH